MKKTVFIAAFLVMVVSVAAAVSAPPMPGEDSSSHDNTSADSGSNDKQSPPMPGSDTNDSVSNTSEKETGSDSPGRSGGFLGSIFSFFGGLF